MAFLSQFNGFDPNSLGLLQRILLVSDGTLTDTLEAAMLEPIRVAKLAMDISQAHSPIADLQLAAGQPIIDRKILLFGENTGRNYVYAESQVAVERLPARFRQELLDTDKPMGRLWSEYKLETWKELLRVSRGRYDNLAAYFPGSGGDLLSRRYRLLSGGSVLMVIQEYFPAASYST